jgi:gliding motility-associated-like protein
MNENGEFTEIAHLSSMTTNYLDDLTNVSPNSLSGKLLYRVEARRNGSTISAFSNIAEVKIHSVFDKIPNAFTPNNDGLNDTFKPLINFIPEKFLMIIYDRYGIPVFQTENPEEGWDGKIRGKGMAIEGVYIYHVQYTSYGGTSNKKTGKVTVFYPRQ